MEMVPAVEAAACPLTRPAEPGLPAHGPGVALAAVLSGSATVVPLRPHYRGPMPSPVWPVGKCLPLPQLLRPRFWGAAAIRPCVTEPLRVGVIGWAMLRNPGAQSALGTSGSPSPRGPAEQPGRELRQILTP